MLKHAKTRIILSTALALVVWAPLALAQAPGGGGGGGRGGRGGGRRGWDPAQMQERMLQTYKEQLKVSDEEWTVLKPLVQAVAQKQWEQRMSRFRGMGRRGRGGGGEGEDNSPAEVKALREALEKEDTPATEIQAKLKALRDANKAREAELEKVREELRQVLTVRQEAQLVLMGVLN